MGRGGTTKAYMSDSVMPPAKSRLEKGTKPVYAYKSHVTSPVQAVGHGPQLYGGGVHVTGTNVTIQHFKYALVSP